MLGVWALLPSPRGSAAPLCARLRLYHAPLMHFFQPHDHLSLMGYNFLVSLLACINFYVMACIFFYIFYTSLYNFSAVYFVRLFLL